ncbi:basement membrane-specific heparan sulfate proteoglycan core protein isoform X4 [Haplochromis burtoni]|uniref:basement membrane-specific heparan sulfate proteoglycan core protein isoform X4 n=1 Tax=Haplochromis burtoni TaxID=8153 RepID=UPI001C2D7A83|nr:basement membrane-specific heparan sulfate proteoglycan core protein isoform X4 [Haplochromis burtoni]
MSQLRHPVSTCATRAAQWKMWLFKVFSVIYAVAVCASEDNDATTYSYRESESTAPPPFEPPVPVLERTSSWSDVFSSEKVVLECKATSSSELIITWKKDGSPLGPNLSLSPDKSVLTITASSTQDSGNYTCVVEGKKKPSQTKESGPVKIKVYASTPKPTLARDSDFGEMFPGESITLTCSVDVSSGWEYLWHNDQHQISGVNTKSYTINSVMTQNSGQYYCQGKRDQFLTHLSESTTLKVIDPPTPGLQLQTAWKDVFEGEAVEFHCHVVSSTPGWTFTWHRNKQQLQNNPVEIINGDGSSLKITSVRQTHKGSYTCKAHLTSRGVNSGFSSEVMIQVSAEKPTLTLTRDPEYDVMFAEEAVTFSCAISVHSAWTYLWYKDGSKVTGSSDKLKVQIRGTADQGSYTCKATRGQNPAFITNSSAAKQLKVQPEKPTLTLTRDPEYDVMFAEEAVTFSCAISVHSAWTYLWYKDGSKVTGSSDKLKVQIRGTADQGSYTCKATRGQNPAFITNSSAAKQLKVQNAPTVTLEQNPAHNLMHSEDSVSFNCHVNVSSGWTNLWYKDGKELGKVSGNNYNITSVTTKDSGLYKCKVKRGKVFDSDNKIKLDVEERPKASIVLLTGWSDVFSTDSLSLKCEVKESTHNWMHYTWFKEGERIDSFNVTHTVTPSNDPDQSTYTCCAHADERPLYSKSSDSFKTKNLLLKRRVLLSISGCIVFGIAAVLIGCVALRVFRKPNGRDDKMEEVNLFPTMAELKITDVPCPLVEYITDASLNAPAKEEEEENGTVCSETTPLPITKQEDQAATTDNQETTETNGGLSSFLK